MKIDDLNDDCLIYIMQFLPVTDRVRIERVSKRWKSISRMSWRGFKHLNFPLAYEYHDILREILRRCGKYLISLKFYKTATPYIRIDSSMLEVVAAYCPNIQHFDASETNSVLSTSVRALSERCTKLVSFAISEIADGNGEKELSLLFEKNKDLKRFYIKFATGIIGECLSKLNSQSVESIIIHEFKFVYLDKFHVLKDFCNLKQLVMKFSASVALTLRPFAIQDTVIKNMISNKNLMYFSLSGNSLRPTSLRQISQLKNLKALILASVLSLDDSILASIENHCKLLELLDISGNNLVTNAGLANVFALPNLTFLNISHLENINDQVFLEHEIPHRLRRVDCGWCANMRDPGLAKLIETSENLEYLNLQSCWSISSYFVEAAVRATNKRRNRVKLELIVCNTHVQLRDLQETSPFLHVICDVSEILFSSDYEVYRSFMPHDYETSFLYRLSK